MVRKYVLALAGGALFALIGVMLIDDKQVGVILGGVIGAGFGLTYGILKEYS